MRTHIKIVGWVNIVMSILGLVGAAAILFKGILGGLASGGLVGLVVVGTTSAVIATVMGLVSLFGLIAGFAFLSHRPWARFTLILVSVIRLLNFPIGTLFAIYSLWVLFNSETTAIFKAHENL